MRFEPVRRDDDKVLGAIVLPLSQEFVYGTVEGFTSQPGGSGEWTSTDTDTVREGRSAEYPEMIGNGARDSFRDQDVRAQRQVRPVLIHRTNWEGESRASCERTSDLWPTHHIECE
jgi:hypothetical protein